ncbi:DUF6345 domain-containing protein [bacterium]|nr:DUF6345 domain-containing protein [bacterium]MCI0604297.1 DUF6345 domain-containing protein [bacterium]
MLRIHRVAALILFTVAIPCHSQNDECIELNVPDEVGDNLPVFAVSPVAVNPQMLGRLWEILTNQPAVPITQGERALSMQSGTRVVEVSRKSGGAWYADKSQLWKPALTPTLPSDQKAKQLAANLLERIKTVSIPSGPHSELLFSNMGKTLTSSFITAGNRLTELKQLDVQVTYTTGVRPFPENKQLVLPVVGGGGELNFTFGDDDKLISYQGVWRKIEKLEKQGKVIKKAVADEEFRKLMGGLKLKKFRSHLAYYSAPTSLEQKFLYPVYVYHYTAVKYNEDAPMQIVILPATDFGPKLQALEARQRSKTDPPRPRPGSTDPEGDDTRPGAQEVGISWITDSKAVKTGTNAMGFRDAMVAGGWQENFDWGEPVAWETDWNLNDDDWVDAADFVFYAGHASYDRWELRTPDSSRMSFGNVGLAGDPKPDIWGAQDLEWIIINACGPLEDSGLFDPNSSTRGEVFRRWGGVFDGLHQLLGYASEVFDAGIEGPTVAEYMIQQKDTVIDAWFRTAREAQPACNKNVRPFGPKIWAGVLYAEKAGSTAAESPLLDHIWLKGDVAPDPTPPAVIIGMWTTT